MTAADAEAPLYGAASSLITKAWRLIGPSVIFFAVAVAPLPFGSAGNPEIAFWCIVLGVGLIVTPLGQLRRPHVLMVVGAAVIVASYAVVLHEQLSATPWFGISDPLWRDASQALGVTMKGSASIARNEPYFALGSPLACILALICGLVLGSNRNYANTLLWVIAMSGVAYAAYGITAHLFDPTHILWRDKTAYGGDVTGTFINRNTAAVYFGSAAVVCLALLCHHIRKIIPSGPIIWLHLPNRLLTKASRSCVVLFAMTFACLVAMFMTGSRAGVLLSLLALIIAFTLYFRRDLPSRAGITTALAGGGAAALILLQVMGDGINARFGAEGLADEGRLATWRATLRLIADHPWLGTGQGTFVWSYPAYRPDDVSMVGVWDRAHNTLLELAADMGIPLAALVALAWIGIFAILIRGTRARRRDLFIPVAALAVAMVAVLHSQVDFSLQIPGYAIPALTLIGAGLAQSFPSDRVRSPHGKGGESSRSSDFG